MHHSTQKNKNLVFLNTLLKFCVLTEALETDPVQYLDFYEFLQCDDNLVQIKKLFPQLLLSAPSEFLGRLVRLNKSGKMVSLKVASLLRFKKHLDRKGDGKQLFDLCFSVGRTIDDYDLILQAFKGSLMESQRQQLGEKFKDFPIGKALREAIEKDLELIESR